MPHRFYSSGGIRWDTVRSPHGNLWATVGNVAEKNRRRPNRDRALSARAPRDSSRMIARSSSDLYKVKLAGRWRADSRAVTCRWPQDHPAVYTDDRAGICQFTSWITHSSIKAGLWWMISQDEQTSRWILLSQFMLQFKFTNNRQSKEEQGQEEQG